MKYCMVLVGYNLVRCNLARLIPAAQAPVKIIPGLT